MKTWDTIINTAMLGTDKPMPSRDSFPDELDQVISLIESNEAIDKEDRFLQKAAMISNYRRSGFMPLQKPEVTIPKAEPETAAYCSVHASAVLKDIIEEDNTWLLQFWLDQCAGKGQLLMPGILPVILDKAAKDTDLQASVITCSGKRGEWLSRFNPAWDFFKFTPPEDIWQNGKPAERLKILAEIRKTAPSKALSFVQDTWEQENAATRTDLLHVLKINPGADDLPWLEGLLTDKSVKVKEAALDLLKSIPGSSVIAKYQEVLSRAVVLKKEKGLLGLVNKTSIQLQLPIDLDESIFKTGIEKMAPGKSNLDDDTYVIDQLANYVPPPFWEKHFGCTPAQAFEYLEKYANVILSAVGLAASRYDAGEWFPFFLSQKGFYAGLINKLSPKEQEKYLMRFFDQDPSGVIHHAKTIAAEWQPDFTLAALTFMANNPYQYNKSFFKENIRLINTAALSKLNSIAPKDPNLQNVWDRSRDQLIKLLTLKQQIRQVFTA